MFKGIWQYIFSRLSTITIEVVVIAVGKFLEACLVFEIGLVARHLVLLL